MATAGHARAGHLSLQYYLQHGKPNVPRDPQLYSLFEGRYAGGDSVVLAAAADDVSPRTRLQHEGGDGEPVPGLSGGNVRASGP